MRKALACLCLLLVSLSGLTGCRAQAPAPATPAPSVQPTPPTAAAPTPPPSAPPKPGYTVWVVDPSGSKPAEVLAQSDQPLSPLATSPDGRYLLLADWVGMAPHDETAVLYLRDNKTGELRQGPKNWVRLEAVTWSGNGWWVDWLDHVDVNLKLTHNDALAKNLGVDKEHPLISLATTPDRRHLAAVVGHGYGKTADLLLADGDGTHLQRLPDAILPIYAQIVVAPLALSPDGGLLLVVAYKPAAAVIQIAAPDPKNWLMINRDRNFADPTWAPDSQHVYLPDTGILDRNGKVVVPTQEMGGRWTPDGKLLLGNHILTVDEPTQKLPPAPAPNAWPIGFLPDGRWLYAQEVHP